MDPLESIGKVGKGPVLFQTVLMIMDVVHFITQCGVLWPTAAFLGILALKAFLMCCGPRMSLPQLTRTDSVSSSFRYYLEWYVSMHVDEAIAIDRCHWPESEPSR